MILEKVNALSLQILAFQSALGCSLRERERESIGKKVL